MKNFLTLTSTIAATSMVVFFTLFKNTFITVSPSNALLLSLFLSAATTFAVLTLALAKNPNLMEDDKKEKAKFSQKVR